MNLLRGVNHLVAIMALLIPGVFWGGEVAWADNPTAAEFNQWAGIDMPDGIDVTHVTKGPADWYLEGYALTQDVFNGFINTLNGLGRADRVDVLRNREGADHRRSFRMHILIPQNVDTVIIDNGGSSDFSQFNPKKIP